MKMIDQKFLSEIKVSEIDQNKYYIFTYDEEKMEQKEASGYKAIKVMCDMLRASFPDLKFVLCPDFKVEPKEVLDLEQLKEFRELIDNWIKESESN